MKATDNIDYDFTHDHAGNGWAIVQDMGDNFWRVSAIQKDGVDSRSAFLAWGKKLNRTRTSDGERPLTGETLAAVRALRKELKSGEKIVHYQRILPATKP